MTFQRRQKHPGNEEGFSSEGRAKPEDRLQEEGKYKLQTPVQERVKGLEGQECGIKPW